MHCKSKHGLERCQFHLENCGRGSFLPLWWYMQHVTPHAVGEAHVKQLTVSAVRSRTNDQVGAPVIEWMMDSSGGWCHRDEARESIIELFDTPRTVRLVWSTSSQKKSELALWLVKVLVRAPRQTSMTTGWRIPRRRRPRQSEPPMHDKFHIEITVIYDVLEM